MISRPHSILFGLALAVALAGATRESRAETPLTVTSAIQDNVPIHTDPKKFARGLKYYEAGDYARAYATWLPLAQIGDISAMRNVGHMLRRGLGTRRDPERALYFYERAASAGQVGAAANAAFMYLRGDGIPANPEKAASWFYVASRLGLPLAQYNMGVLYETGSGVEKSLPIALGWYGLAAQGGNIMALHRLKLLVPTLPSPPAPAGTASANLPAPAQPPAPQIEMPRDESEQPAGKSPSTP